MVEQCSRAMSDRERKGVTNLYPDSVVWLSKVPVRSTGKIFTVPFSLPLASLPSLIHATEVTLSM